MYVQGTGVFARAAESSPVDSDRDQRMHGDIRRAIGRQNKLVPQGPRILLEKLLVVSSVHDFGSRTLPTRHTIPLIALTSGLPVSIPRWRFELEFLASVFNPLLPVTPLLSRYSLLADLHVLARGVEEAIIFGYGDVVASRKTSPVSW